jgi:O-antigen biosynthesis protein
MNNITTCISTYNNLPYLKLAIKSIRKYSHFKDMPVVVYAENCDDGTDEWLVDNAEKYGLTYLIEHNDPAKGIGGGLNVVADMVQTEFINFIHADMVVSQDWDLELYKMFEKYPDEKLWVNSHRVEPDMFGGESRPGTVIIPREMFGYTHDEFEERYFIDWAAEFTEQNDVEIPKGEGVSGMIRKVDWDHIGGNDDRFAPAWWEDFDLFLRMKNEGYRFILPSKSLVFHFGARSSHFPKDDFTRESSRSKECEPAGAQKFVDKWGGMPAFDEWGMICGIK